MAEFTLEMARARPLKAARVQLPWGDHTYCRDGLTGLELMEIVDANRMTPGAQTMRYFQVLLANADGSRVYPKGTDSEKLKELHEYPADFIGCVIEAGKQANPVLDQGVKAEDAEGN